jgi:hypothetical protein
VARSGPPAYAWDWFARQRLLWRETRSRLAAGDGDAATRYGAVELRSDVLAMLRADLPRDDHVRRTVEAVVAELTFLGRTDRPFAELGANNAPRGMRWWWTAVTGEELDGAAAATSPSAPDRREPAPTQLPLDDVFEGYGG